SIEGLGRESLKLTKYFFEKLNAMNIPTHYLDSNLDEVSMIVKPAQVFGNGLEFICRKKVGGSFLKRYGTYAEFGQELDYFIEVTLKDDERLDPPITKDALIALSLLTDDEYETCNKLTKKITKIIHDDLAEKGLELHDLKFEFGKHDGEILLIDEISGGCMRVFKDGVQIEPMELTQLILG
ncbi:MAG: phosphoribosylaminoimidazolesuccinocarboxamide synthase, partial [Streptococcaceae bacterium]|nr:phosphoribosylaminoimidazolesuccinocarboxamide synthase [Streptococcaceae bacterium]